MARFTIWEGGLGGISLMRGEGPPLRGDEPEDADAVLIKSFEAASWVEAIQVQYDHYGWGTYVEPEVAVWEEIGPNDP